MSRRSTWLPAALLGWLALGVPGCGDRDAAEPVFAVLSAFPAELAAVLERAAVEETVEVDGRFFRLGRIGRTGVVIGMTGIGLLNASATTRVLLDRFNVAGVVVSGVAGSFLRIGDVTVAATWKLEDGNAYAAHPPWLAVAAEISRPGAVALERCAIVPETAVFPGVAVGQEVCLPHEPAIVVGGVGESSDPFGRTPFGCRPQGDDVFGCDVGSPGVVASPGDRVAGAAARAAEPSATDAEPFVVDEETAAIARETAARGLPFIAFRAVSDGAGDPLGLPGFPSQFFVYYRLTARNAAAAAAAFLERAR